MTAWIVLLRAVNVGGTGRLAMSELARLCRGAGFTDVRTVGASGNVVLRGEGCEAQVRAALEVLLQAGLGRPMGVVVRSQAEIGEVLARNPFAGEPGDRVLALFTDAPLAADPLEGASGRSTEQVRPGQRELFIFHPEGVGRSRLRLPTSATGTARNMNTLARLAKT